MKLLKLKLAQSQVKYTKGEKATCTKGAKATKVSSATKTTCTKGASAEGKACCAKKGAKAATTEAPAKNAKLVKGQN